MDLNGFQILQSEHVLGQDPGDSIYFSPLIFFIQSSQGQKKKKKEKNPCISPSCHNKQVHHTSWTNLDAWKVQHTNHQVKAI